MNAVGIIILIIVVLIVAVGVWYYVSIVDARSAIINAVSGNTGTTTPSSGTVAVTQPPVTIQVEPSTATTAAVADSSVAPTASNGEVPVTVTTTLPAVSVGGIVQPAVSTTTQTTLPQSTVSSLTASSQTPASSSAQVTTVAGSTISTPPVQTTVTNPPTNTATTVTSTIMPASTVASLTGQTVSSSQSNTAVPVNIVATTSIGQSTGSIVAPGSPAANQSVTPSLVSTPAAVTTPVSTGGVGTSTVTVQGYIYVIPTGYNVKMNGVNVVLTGPAGAVRATGEAAIAAFLANLHGAYSVSAALGSTASVNTQPIVSPVIVTSSVTPIISIPLPVPPSVSGASSVTRAPTTISTVLSASKPVASAVPPIYTPTVFGGMSYSVPAGYTLKALGTNATVPILVNSNGITVASGVTSIQLYLQGLGAPAAVVVGTSISGGAGRVTATASPIAQNATTTGSTKQVIVSGVTYVIPSNWNVSLSQSGANNGQPILTGPAGAVRASGQTAIAALLATMGKTYSVSQGFCGSRCGMSYSSLQEGFSANDYDVNANSW